MSEIALPEGWTPALTPELREATAAAIQEDRAQGNVAALRAAGAVGSKGHLRKLINDDDEIQHLIADTRGYSPEAIENEIVRRAIEGVSEPVFNKDGEHVGDKVVYSDRLLALLAKARHPSYRDKVEVTGADGGALEVNSPDVAAAIERFTATVTRLTDRAQPGGAVRSLAAAATELPPGGTGS